MSSNSLENLPPEMQERIRSIMAQGQAPVTAQPGPPPGQAIGRENYAPAPIQKPPSLMDHLLALRQEVAAMRQEMAGLSGTVEANSNVVEAVGQAVGTIYQMFQQTPNQATTYSSEFQQAQQSNEDY
tara:strand:+ start:909 stop:1289 length:381 start_codon:yes stop_codon:yes gene_type:complete